jgi:hypothetical protein
MTGGTALRGELFEVIDLKNIRTKSKRGAVKPPFTSQTVMLRHVQFNNNIQ